MPEKNLIETDVAIIGAGTAGLGAHRAAKAAGKRALLIEDGAYGTTCARVGCMPSKLLLAAAEAAHGASRFEAFGLHLPGPLRIDGAAVMARVKRERDGFVAGVIEDMAAIPAAEKLRGHARFLDASTLQVGQLTRVRAGSIVIATGSAPSLPDEFKALGERAIVNDDVFAWDTLPSAVAVIGAGPIGLELGQALSRLGVRVRVLGRKGSVGALSDPAIRRYAAETLADEFALDADATVLSARRRGNDCLLRFRQHDGREIEESFDFVLSATGRKPNLAGLGLEQAGLVLDHRGVPLFDPATLQCGNSAIFIAGDADADRPLLHEAVDEGRAAGENAARYPQIEPRARRTALAIVFTEPNIALAGATWHALQDRAFATGEANFENQGRARVLQVNKGLLHLYADRQSHRLLGGEMIAPHAEHYAHLLAWSIQAGFTVEQALAMPFYHPVLEEGLRTALRNLAGELGDLRPRCEGPCAGE